MSKITLTNVGSLIDATTAVTTINNNFSTLQTAFDNTFSLDGTSPNQLKNNIDTNSYRILNLPKALTAQEPLRFQDLSDFKGGGTVTNIPAGGGSGAILVKTSNLDYQVGWGTVAAGLLAGTNITVTGSPIATIATVANPTFATRVTTPLLVLNGTSLSTFTGTGAIVLATSPTLITPALGTPSAGVLTNCTGLPVGSLTGLGTGIGTFLVTPSSANLATAITDETGSGLLVFSTNPVLVTPTIGAATATSINKVTITAPATAAILTIANNKTFTVNNTITFSGTDATVLTLPTITDTIPGLSGTNIWSGANTFPNNGGLRVLGSSTGVALLANNNASSSSFTITIPGTATDTLVARTSTDTLTNKTMSGSSNTFSNIAQSSLAFTTNVTKQIFSASGTYTPTSGMAHCIIECWGGGGGGGGSAGTGASNQSSAGGGGAGSYARTYSTAAAIGASKVVTLGALGTGGAAGNNAGVAGGTTSVGALCIAPGGSGGGGTGGSSGATGGAGGTGATGDVVGSGQSGFSAVGGATFVTIGFAGGAGGASSIGGGGASPNITGAGGFNGLAASGWAAGGSGGSSFNSATTASGGNGTAGLVVITEFINV